MEEAEFDGAFERADLEENDWIYKTDLPLLLKDAFKVRLYLLLPTLLPTLVLPQLLALSKFKYA